MFEDEESKARPIDNKYKLNIQILVDKENKISVLVYTYCFLFRLVSLYTKDCLANQILVFPFSDGATIFSYTY